MTEYAELGSLQDIIEAQQKAEFIANKEPISEEEILMILEQICLALKFLHDRNVCHLGLKPSSILMTSESCVKIADLSETRLAKEKGE